MIVGCGYVGTELGRQLVRSGHEVFGLRRRAERLPGEIQPVASPTCGDCIAEDSENRRATPRHADRESAATLDGLPELTDVGAEPSSGLLEVVLQKLRQRVIAAFPKR